MAEGDALAEEANLSHPRIDVDVEEFIRWCAMVAVRPCLPAMRAFLIVKRHALHQVPQGGFSS